jgi:hypothetical protein
VCDVSAHVHTRPCIFRANTAGACGRIGGQAAIGAANPRGFEFDTTAQSPPPSPFSLNTRASSVTKRLQCARTTGDAGVAALARESPPTRGGEGEREGNPTGTWTIAWTAVSVFFVYCGHFYR